MMLLTLLISRKMIFGRNLSIARVAGGGNEGCVVGTRVGRCAWEAVHSADSPSSKPSSAASTLWSLTLVPSDDWEAASTVGTNGSLKASRKMNRSFELLCNFPFISDPVCKQTGVMRYDQYKFLLKKNSIVRELGKKEGETETESRRKRSIA
jgi:hypothetical protein